MALILLDLLTRLCIYLYLSCQADRYPDGSYPALIPFVKTKVGSQQLTILSTKTFTQLSRYMIGLSLF